MEGCNKLPEIPMPKISSSEKIFRKMWELGPDFKKTWIFKMVESPRNGPFWEEEPAVPPT